MRWLWKMVFGRRPWKAWFVYIGLDEDGSPRPGYQIFTFPSGKKSWTEIDYAEQKIKSITGINKILIVNIFDLDE